MAALGRRGRHGSNWEAQSTQAGAVESGSHPATHRMKGETGMAAGGKPSVEGPIKKIAFSCVSNGAIKRTFSAFQSTLSSISPQETLKIKLSTSDGGPVLIRMGLYFTPSLVRMTLPPSYQPSSAGQPSRSSELKKSFFLRRSPITSLYFRSSNHISSQSEIKKFACHLLISFLSVKQPSKTCFPPLERSKLQ